MKHPRSVICPSANARLSVALAALGGLAGALGCALEPDPGSEGEAADEADGADCPNCTDSSGSDSDDAETDSQGASETESSTRSDTEQAEAEAEAESDTGPEPPLYDDPLVYVAPGHGDEVVATAWDGERFAVNCGGFGARIDDLSDPADPQDFAVIPGRCQNLDFGAFLPGGERMLYLAHHGDSYGGHARLEGHVVDVDGPVPPDDPWANASELFEFVDAERLFEGLVWRDHHLFVTEHQRGLEIFATDPLTGQLDTEPVGGVGALGALGNAIEIALVDDFAYVADAEGFIHVVDVAQLDAPALLSSTPTPGSPRHLDVDQGRLFVALGGDGIASYDLADPAAPSLLGQQSMQGSAQAVDADGELLAVAAWTYSAVHDAEDLSLLATERVVPYPDFEQDLAVVLDGTMMLVGEWEGMHVLDFQPGVTAPDAWIDEELFAFEATEASDRVVVIENRGLEPLVVSEVYPLHESFSVLADLPMTIAPGSKDAFELAYAPPAPDSGAAILVIETDDPDIYHASYQVGLVAQDIWLLDVGESLTEDYAFLDPLGLEGLEGKVLVLSYFALF